MITDVKQHWAEVIEIRDELIRNNPRTGDNPDGAVYLASQRHRQMRVVDGRITVATPHIAAVMIVQNTHREATQEEIERWKAEQRAKGSQIVSEAAKKENKITPELIGQAVGSAVTATLAARDHKAEPAPAREHAAAANADPFDR